MNRQKGIVFENTSSYSIFLTDDGRFLKGIPDSVSDVGEEVSFRPYVEVITMKKPKSTAYMAPLIAAVAIVFMFFSVLLPSQSKVSAYVQVDFNPSIELGIDNHGDVQVFRGLNEDGIALKRDISFWKGKSLTWVLSEIVDESNISFEDEDQFGVTTIISEKQNQVALEKIITTAVTQTTVKITPEKIKMNQATTKERLQANEKGVSIGTYKELQEKNLKENSKEKPAKSQPKENNKNVNPSNTKKDKQNKNNERPKNKEQKQNKDEKQEKNDQRKNNDQKINNSKQKDDKDQKNKEQQNSSNKQKNSNQSHSKSNERSTKNSNKDNKAEYENRNPNQQKEDSKKHHDHKKNSNTKSHDNQKAQKQQKNNSNDQKSKRSNEKRNDR